MDASHAYTASLERQTFVPWVGHNHGAVAKIVDGATTGAIATSLIRGVTNAKLLEAVRRSGCGVVAEPEAWRNQRGSFTSAAAQDAWAGSGATITRGYEPSSGFLSEDSAIAYAERVLEAELVLNPTTLVSPSHYVASEDSGPGRANDIALARAFSSMCFERRLREPYAMDVWGRPRTVFAGITVDCRARAGGMVEELVSAYSSVPADGYMLWPAGFTGGLREASFVAELALRLQLVSGRPVVVGGVGHWHIALLAFGIAATCFGPQRSSVPAIPVPDPHDDAERKRASHIYHPRVLGYFPQGAKGARAAADVFARFGCACGTHDARRPPVKKEIGAHNRWWLAEEARRAIEAHSSANATWVSQRGEEAAAARVSVGMGSLKPCWRVVRPDAGSAVRAA